MAESIVELADCPGYGVDRDGNVWSRFSLAIGKPLMPTWQRKLSQKTRKDGYREVSICGTAFYGQRPQGMEARHRNGVKSDNRVGNVLWGTPVENKADQLEHGTRCRGETHGRRKLTAGQVSDIRKMYEAGIKKDEIARRFGIHPNHVNRLASRTRWKHLAT